MTLTENLTALTAPAAADLLYIVDDPSGTPTGKKITVQNLLGAGRSIAWLTNNGTLRSQAYTTPTAAAFAQAATGSGSQGSGLSADAANNRIQITEDGIYRVTLSIYLLTTSGSEPVMQAQVTYNGAKIPGSLQLHPVATTTAANVHFNGVLDTNGTTSQYVQINFACLTTSLTLASSYWALVVERVGNT